MTKWLWLFLAFYILVWQPALLWRILNNYNLYELALLNAGVFFAGWIISTMCKTSSNDNIIDSNLQWKLKNEKVESAKSVQKDIKEVKDNKEEKIAENANEEKEDEKSVFKSMKESVTIPKIVQPLTWHSSQKKKKKKEVKWWQWLILLLTLCLAAVIAWTLWEFLWNWWIAISLFLGWILYLIIGKLFDINWFYNAKKLFTNRLYIVLILAWIWYWVYSMQQDNSSSMKGFSENAISYIKWLFDTDNKDNNQVDTWSVIYVFEWTGEIIQDTWIDVDNLLESTWTVEIQTWVIENNTGKINTWTINKIEPENKEELENNNQTEENKEQVVNNTEDLNKKITIWEAIKSLLSWAKLSSKTNVSFVYVSKSNELYPYFKTAQEKTMIGTDTNPNKLISCDTYIVMKWLREWRNVGNYTSATVKTIYWNKAVELWKLNWCKKWSYLTKANL